MDRNLVLPHMISVSVVVIVAVFVVVVVVRVNSNMISVPRSRQMFMSPFVSHAAAIPTCNIHRR